MSERFSYQALPSGPAAARDLEAAEVFEDPGKRKQQEQKETALVSRDAQTLEPQYFVPTQFIAQSQGIPVLRANRFRLQQLCLWVAAIAVACALPMLSVNIATHSEFVHMKLPIGHIDIRTRNCDVIFEEAPSNASDVRIRVTHWNIFGASGSIEREGNGVAVKVSRSDYSLYFRCETLIHLPRWSSIGKLDVQTFSGDAVLVESTVPFHVEGVATFKLHEANVKLFGLQAPAINATISEGALDLAWNETRININLNVNTTKAPVFIRSSNTTMRLKCSAGTLPWVSTSGVEIETATQGGLSTKGGIHIEAEAAQAPVVLSCIDCASENTYFGSEHHNPGFAPISLESLDKAHDWLHDIANPPWVLYLNVIGANLPNGRWMLLSSSVYLALPLHFFAIFSMGILAPQGLQINMYPLGLNVSMDCKRSRESLMTSGHHTSFEDQSLSSSCSVKSQDAQRSQLAAMFDVLWDALDKKGLAPRGSQVLVWQSGEGKKLSVKRVKGAMNVETQFFATTWMLTVATCTSIIGSLLASIYLLILADRWAKPWLMSFNAEQMMSATESLRLLHTMVGARWRLVSGVVNSPHGVLIKWSATSQQHHFTSILVSVKGRKGDSEHMFSFYASRSHLSTHRQHSGLSEGQDEFMFQLLITCAKQGPSSTEHPPHEELRLGYQYSFCLHSVDAFYKVMETSAWSSEVTLMPPTSAFDVPTMLINAFFPKQLESLELFIDEYGKMESMQMIVGITDVELVLVDEPLHHTCQVIVQWNGFDEGKQISPATYRKDPSKTVQNHDQWHEGFVNETVNIFGKSVKEVNAARGGGMEHIMDVGTVYTRNGNQRVNRAQLLLERTDMEQTELMIHVEHQRGGQIAHGRISFKQIVNRWGDQLGSFAKTEPLEIELDGATIRCNVLVGESPKNMLIGPESAFDTVVPNEIWYHGEEKMMGWDKVLLMKCLEDLGFDKNIKDLRKDCVVVFTLAARSRNGSMNNAIFGNVESKLWGEYELDFEKLSLHVPADTTLEGWFEVGMDTVWIQKKSDLPRLRGTPDKYPGHERRKKGVRWADISELYNKGVVWVKEGADWVQKKAAPSSNAQAAFGMLSTHKLQIMRPVLVQDFELAYASWCSAHHLAMGRVTEAALENSRSRVSVTELQLKVCSGLRAALPFEAPFQFMFQEGCSFVSTSHLLLGDDDAKMFGLTSGNHVIRSKVKKVQLMQGFKWVPRKWTFEPSLENAAGIVWGLKTTAGRRNRFVRWLVELYGLLEVFFWFLLQVLLSMIPAVLCLGGVIWAQRCGLDYDPSYMMSSSDPGWMAPQWLLTPHEAFPRGFECVPLYVALGYVLVSMPLMGYMFFGQHLVPRGFRAADALSDTVQATIFIAVSFIVMLINFWVFLGSLLNSGKFLPIAIMIGSAIGMVATQWKSLNTSRTYLAQLIEKHMEYFLDCAFDRLLKEFVQESLSSASGTDEKRRQYKQAIMDDISDDVAKARMKSSEAKKKEKEAMDEDEGSQSDSGSLTSSSAESEYDEEEDPADNNQDDIASQETSKFDKIFEQLNLRTPLAENIAECLEEPRQLALQALEERKEQLEVIEQRFLSPGSAQIAELYEEKMECLERAFVNVVKRSFDEDKLVDAISHFIDQVLPQLIFLQAQSHARDISRVRRAVRDKWPAEKKAGLKLDLKMKLSDSLASSSKKSSDSSSKLGSKLGSKEFSRKSSQSQFSNEDIRGMTVYEFLCHKDVAIFPQLSQASKEYDGAEDMDLAGGYSNRYCIKDGVNIKPLTIDHIIMVENGAPRTSEGRWKWGVQFFTRSGKLCYAFKVEASHADGNKIDHVTSNQSSYQVSAVRSLPVPKRPVKKESVKSAAQEFSNASSKIEVAVRRTKFGFAFWAAGRRCTELDFYMPADSKASFSRDEIAYVEVYGLQGATVKYREEPKDKLHLRGEDLDTFAVQESMTQKLNSYICRNIIKGAYGRKSVELRKADVLRLLQDLLEGCIWWEEFERLVLHTLDIKIKPEALKAYWIEKTKDSLLMPIKDVAENIMWLTGKMLWPTAFVLMCRDRELFPEIFLLTEVLPAKDAKDIRLKVEDESKERLEDQLDICERDPQRFKKEFNDIVSKMEIEYFDQIKREISSRLRAKQADKMSLQRLREKEKQLKLDQKAMRDRLNDLEHFVDSESDLDDDIKDHQNEYQQIIGFGTDEDRMMMKQLEEIQAEKKRLNNEVLIADRFVKDKRNSLLVKTEMEAFEKKIMQLRSKKETAPDIQIRPSIQSAGPTEVVSPPVASEPSHVQPKVKNAGGLGRMLGKQSKVVNTPQDLVAHPGPREEVLSPARRDIEEARSLKRAQSLELAQTEKAAREKHVELQASFRKIFNDYRANKANLKQLELQQEQLQAKYQSLRDAKASEAELDAHKDRLGEVDENISDMENLIRSVDLNNLIVLYPLRQLEFQMHAREESDGVKVWSADAMDEILVVECWDEDRFCLSQEQHVQKSLKEWMLMASLAKLESQKRDDLLANIQKEQIERPPNKGDIEHADDSVWKNYSKMFEYLWDKYAEKAPDREAFTDEMISRQACLPLIMDIFFDTMVLREGLIETDVDASVDKEHLPENMQILAEDGDLFRITNRDEDNWKLKNHEVWKAQSGDLHLNAISVETDLFYGNCKLQQMGDGYYTNTASSQVWLRSSKTSFRVIRGIWFDAFVDICAEVGLPIDRTSGWILWNLVTSEELMRDENIDLIMCREMRLTAEARRVVYRGEDLSDPDDREPAKWMLKLTSNKMIELKGQGRRHPWADAGSNAVHAIDVAKVTRLKEEALVLLGYESDSLHVMLELHDPQTGEFRKVAVGDLQWLESKENEILTNSQFVDLIDPRTREKIGKVELEFELDNSYKGIFNALDFDETNKMSISQFEQQHLIAELSEKKAKSFGCQDDAAPLDLIGDADEANLRARVKDWSWGFVDPQIVRQNLLKLLERAPFVSKLMFHTFLKAAHLDLPEKTADEIWRLKLDEICPLTLRWGEEVIPVRGLVTIEDCWKKLTRHIKKATYWELDDAKKAQLRLKRGLPVGGIWFLPYYNVMMSSCRAVHSEEQLREVYNAERDEKTGLMPLEGIFNSIEKIGRPGLPYESFRSLIRRLGLTVEESQIRSAFFFIDVNQMNCLNKKELLQCTLVLMKTTLPYMLLQELNLTIECIVPHILASLTILVCLFSFILLAFSSLTAGGDRNAAIQSILSVGAAYGLKKERNTKKTKLAEKAIMWMEKLFGFKAKAAGNRQRQSNDDSDDDAD